MKNRLKIPFFDIYIISGKLIKAKENEIENLKQQISKKEESSIIWNKVFSKKLDEIKRLNLRLKRYEG